MNKSYAKAFLAVVVSATGALVTALGTGATDVGDLDTKSWLIAGGAVLGSGGIVWFVENVPGVLGGAVKTVVGFLSAGVASLVIAIDDSAITQAEWLTAFSAAVVATGLVYQAKE
jgi:hypothetical protein